MKQRFSSIDVAVIAHELSQSLCSLRVSNIYDLSSRIFLFKLHKPDHREQLIIECGFRCHLTKYARTTATEPSPFVERLRKLLRTRRISSVAQVGTDRIIEFQFSDGQYRLFLEFYAAGNIIVTDAGLKILALFRPVNEGAEHEKLRLGLQYDVSHRQNFGGVPPLTKERVRESLRKAIRKQQTEAGAGKRKEKDALRKALSTSITEFPPHLVDHAFSVVDFESSLKPEEVLEAEYLLDKLMLALEEAKRVVKEITSADVVKGYILAKPRAPGGGTSSATDNASLEQSVFYHDFHPFRPRQFENDPNLKFIEIEGFNNTVDEFFSSLEGQKLENRLQEREAAAKRKLDQARADHEKRLGGLQEAQQLNVRKAEAIKANVERVREAIAAVNGLIEKGMDWVEIARLIEREQEQGNSVARMIKLPLKLYENTITLLLAEESFDDEEDEADETSSADSESESETEQVTPGKKKPPPKQQDKRLAIDIDLGLSPWANASQYHSQKKTAAIKEEKTAQAMEKALKNTERKIAADLKKALNQEKEALRPVRQHFWFEKFTYFLSSDGYLVIGGKDVQQNEIIYQRHFVKGDIYVHADLPGAVPLIIKNTSSSPDAPIPPSTLSQAGTLAVSTSSAWDSKAIMSAWWVKFDQVSKTGHGGEYLTPGVFVISGEKNYLPPAQLVLGFAVIFQISEESKARHVKHRVVEQSMAETSNEAAEPEEATQAQDRAQASDSDEEFPDAKLESDDEDFPDAKLDSDPEKADQTGEPHSAVVSQDQDLKNRGRDVLEGEDEHQESGETEETGEDIKDSNDTPKESHRYISAKERRQMRKGQGQGNSATLSQKAVEATVSEDEEASQKHAKSTGTNTPSSTSTPKGPLPRGKRGKAKKAAAKYADQDEEDRALAMRLLGVQPAHQTALSAALTKQSKEDEAQAQKQRRREQHLRAQALGKAAEQARRSANAAASAAPSSADDAATAAAVSSATAAEADEPAAAGPPLDLATLTGRPLAGDALLAALPVCAPWAALAAYKYRVKLVPGAGKKGRAVREILARWQAEARDPRRVDRQALDGEKVWPVEAELIGAWKEGEVVGVVPVGGVRVVAGAGGAGGGKGGGGGGGKGKGKGGGGGKSGGGGGKGGKKK